MLPVAAQTRNAVRMHHTDLLLPSSLTLQVETAHSFRTFVPLSHITLCHVLEHCVTWQSSCSDFHTMWGRIAQSV
jgi:hypothetical protein